MVDYKKTIKKIFVCDHLPDYFIEWGGDQEWKDRVDHTPSEAQDALAALAANWKYARNTATLPWLAMHLAGNSVAEFTNKDSDWTERLWSDCVTQDEFRLTLAGSQALAYTGFYFGYENFLTESCVAKIPNSTTSDFKNCNLIKKGLKKAFNSSIEKTVWSDNKIIVAREARNSLVHNGGKASGKLKNMGAQLVEDGHVCVHPILLKELFQTLKEKVDLILNNW
jgi:hypothetical protein